MIVYIYNKDGYFKNEHECQTGIKGETLYPAGNYTEKKPQLEIGKIPKFVNDKWENVDDYRGKVIYNKETLQKDVCKTIEKYNDTYTEIAPPDETYSWNADKWEIDPTKVKNKEILETQTELNQNDIPYIRLIEDLIDTLINKGVISILDLPQSAQEKYNEKKALRAKLIEE